MSQLKGALKKNHDRNINPSAMETGARLESKMIGEIHSSQREIPYQQPLPSPLTGQDGSQQITGYKLSLYENDISRIVSPTGEQNALQSVIEAKQGLQTFGSFTTADPYDEMVNLMKSVGMDADGVIPGVGKVVVPKESPFWEYAARKKAMEFHDAFKKFIYSQIDLTTPERRAYWESHFPEYTESLRTGLHKNRMLRARMEDIGLYGVQNEKDMWLLYLKEKGNADNEKYITQEFRENGLNLIGNPAMTPGREQRFLGAPPSSYNWNDGANGLVNSRTPPGLLGWSDSVRNMFYRLGDAIQSTNNSSFNDTGPQY